MQKSQGIWLTEETGTSQKRNRSVKHTFGTHSICVEVLKHLSTDKMSDPSFKQRSEVYLGVQKHIKELFTGHIKSLRRCFIQSIQKTNSFSYKCFNTDAIIRSLHHCTCIEIHSTNFLYDETFLRNMKTLCSSFAYSRGYGRQNCNDNKHV